jgi:inosine/xanthosine triphosphatase
MILIVPSYSTLLAFIYTMSNKEKLMQNDWTIAVGSKNPVKVNAVSRGFEQVASFFPPVDGLELLLAETNAATPRIEGIDVPSGVSDQPMGDRETKTGALNRATAAYTAYEKLNGAPPRLSVGLEGGVSVDSETNIMECFAWIFVFDGKRSGAARTASFPLPPVMRDMVMKEGMELGDADDKVRMWLVVGMHSRLL